MRDVHLLKKCTMEDEIFVVESNTENSTLLNSKMELKMTANLPFYEDTFLFGSSI